MSPDMNYVLSHTINVHWKSVTGILVLRCRVGYLKCSKEDSQNSESWVQVRPRTMEGQEKAVAILNGREGKQEMRALGRV